MGESLKVFVDVETTGFVPFGASVIVLSAIVSRNFREKSPLKKFTLKCRPLAKKYWSEGAENVHGISWNEAKSFPRPEKFIDSFLKELDPFRQKDNVPLEFWYHGLRKFDYIKLYELFFMFNAQFRLNKLFSLTEVYSTIPVVKKVADLPNYKLNTCAKYFNIDLEHHLAESDVNACYQIWRKADKTFL